MDTIGARLRSERERLHLSQTEFGKRGGASKPSQVRYEHGERFPDANYLAAVAAAGVDVLYVVTGERSAAPLPGLNLSDVARTVALMPEARIREAAQAYGPAPAAPPDAGDLLFLPLYDARLAAGAGAVNDAEPVIAQLAFRRDWLRDRGIRPDRAALVHAAGDSMEPTLRDGDLLLVDRADRAGPARPRARGDSRPAAIYALLDGGEARVKRLELLAPGQLAVLSDNPAHPPELRPATEIAIIGRVRWWGHTES